MSQSIGLVGDSIGYLIKLAIEASSNSAFCKVIGKQ
jgi:hypothetical protein